jgi:transcriptional regulator with XRE-family HTH domain
MSLTPEQMKAARQLLGWSRSDLAGHSGVSDTTIGKYETENKRASVLDLSVVRQVLEAAGVEFTKGDQPGAWMKLLQNADIEEALKELSANSPRQRRKP